ncbi:Predicted acyltransferase, LPLAT superfamily [Desulfonauticus submarinus]|uniref:Predicted acyltransferase, LPLAT superfamily n=1 Tax=Desulfonauticus submarinus TaxID=206665 RepID=A0A1H0FTY5_9BACT|nr:lysophospholipid acyltransferase family protein [Desulfonauticus submarinus]SDN98021.1 Predicted acyltransferase, LPLAT superfamily [Desulfonauticus submarinus]
MDKTDQNNNSPKDFSSPWKYLFFYTLIKLGGAKLAYFFLYIIVFYYTLKPSIRQKTSFYLSKKFSHPTFKHYYKLNLNFGKILLDRAIFKIQGKIKLESKENDRTILKSLIKQNRGLIILTAHVGCWQLALAHLNFLSVPINIVYKPGEGIELQNLEETKKLSSFKFIDPTSSFAGALEMSSFLKKGQILCIMGDRGITDKNWIKVKFLGKEAKFPLTPFRLSSLTQAPIAVIFCPRIGVAKATIILAKVIHVPPLGRKKENYKPYVQEFANALEKCLKKYPYQFFNFYNMWA